MEPSALVSTVATLYLREAVTPVSLGVSLPNVAAGSYYLIGFPNSGGNLWESSYANNTLAVPITLGIPDLAPVSVTWSGQPVAGQGLTLNMVVTNIGNGSANGDWYDTWVLSTNTTLAGAVPNGTFSTGFYGGHSVSAGGSYTSSLGVSLPNVAAGSYYLIGFPNSGGNLWESSSANNTLAVPITLGIPDLEPVSVTWSGQPVAGQGLTLNMVVTNIGNGSANGDWYDTWALSTNATLAGAVPNGTFSTGYYSGHSVSAGGSYAVSLGVSLPNVAAGSYYLIGFPNSGGNLWESSSANNTLSVPMTLGIPDLEPVSVTWSGQPVAGQGLTLNMVVANLGSGSASGDWYDTWALSTNATLAGAVPNGTFSTGYYSGHSVSAGGSYAVSLGVSLPNVAAGSYYLIGFPNSSGNLWESSYANNTSAPLAITIGTTDLTATNLSIGGTAIAGRNLSVSFTVSNIGTNAYASYWYDGVTLSSNSTLAGAITNWDWYAYHSTAAGGSYVETQTIALPGVAAGANYYLIAQADDRNFVPESNKNNNTVVLQISITNLPPTNLVVLTPTNGLTLTSCIPLRFKLSAMAQLGSYEITNVEYFDGATPIGHATSPPYGVLSAPLAQGTHVITAQAMDQYNLQATSQVTSLTINWPPTNHLFVSVNSNQDCVICMGAQSNQTYIVETATALQTHANWQPYLTNTAVNEPVGGPILIFTNHPTLPQRYFRAVTSP